METVAYAAGAVGLSLVGIAATEKGFEYAIKAIDKMQFSLKMLGQTSALLNAELTLSIKTMPQGAYLMEVALDKVSEAYKTAAQYVAIGIKKVGAAVGHALKPTSVVFDAIENKVLDLDSAMQKTFGGKSAGAMDIGSPVRCIRAPYFGKLGTVEALPAELQVLDSEAKVRVLDVKFDNGEIVTVPRANVELIEE